MWKVAAQKTLWRSPRWSASPGFVIQLFNCSFNLSGLVSWKMPLKIRTEATTEPIGLRKIAAAAPRKRAPSSWFGGTALAGFAHASSTNLCRADWPTPVTWHEENTGITLLTSEESSWWSWHKVFVFATASVVIRRYSSARVGSSQIMHQDYFRLETVFNRLCLASRTESLNCRTGELNRQSAKFLS